MLRLCELTHSDQPLYFGVARSPVSPRYSIPIEELMDRTDSSDLMNEGHIVHESAIGIAEVNVRPKT